MIRVGTSGFSYDDWVGRVYPAGLPGRDMLPYYASQFDTVELNVTYYRVPGHNTVQGWARRTPDDFLFAVKAYGGITHERTDPDFAGFTESLRPLTEAGKLGCILAQFPNSFGLSPQNRDYLKTAREGFGDLPVVVEFRNAAWVTEPTFELLRSLNLGFCCVDEPRLRGLMPPVARATGPVAYLRFHGRNAARWYAHEAAWQRYDYTYTADELREWTPRLRQLDAAAPITLVYFNNHYEGQAVRGARDLQQLLLEDES
jgi:uncharacterized protein YecE (DUF72 family)